MTLAEIIWEEIDEQLQKGMDELGALAVNHAKRLAPVRKVFESGRTAKVRDITRAEIAAAPRSFQQALIPNTARFGPGVVNPGAPAQVVSRRSGASAYAPILPANVSGQRGMRVPSTFRGLSVERNEYTGRVTASLSEPAAQGYLTSRGRYELAHAEERGAIYDVKGERGLAGKGDAGVPTLGGTLRGEIGYSWISAGPIFEIAIESPHGGEGRSAAYSQYVELPTSRTAAQPYLRPTLAAMARPLVTMVRRVARRLGGE